LRAAVAGISLFVCASVRAVINQKLFTFACILGELAVANSHTASMVDGGLEARL
jgi:hypothetical protein